MLSPLYQMLLMHQKVLGATNAEAVLSAGVEIVLVGYGAEACRSHWDSAAGEHALWSHPAGPAPKVPVPPQAQQHLPMAQALGFLSVRLLAP